MKGRVKQVRWWMRRPWVVVIAATVGFVIWFLWPITTYHPSVARSYDLSYRAGGRFIQHGTLRKWVFQTPWAARHSIDSIPDRRVARLDFEELAIHPVRDSAGVAQHFRFRLENLVFDYTPIDPEKFDGARVPRQLLKFYEEQKSHRAERRITCRGVIIARPPLRKWWSNSGYKEMFVDFIARF